MMVSYMSPSRGAKKAIAFLFPESIAKHLKIVKSATELFSIVPKAHYDNASADAERILKRWWHSPIVSFIDTRDTQRGKSRSHYFCHQIHIFLRRDSGKNGFSFLCYSTQKPTPFRKRCLKIWIGGGVRKRRIQLWPQTHLFQFFSGKNISFYSFYVII